jgi:hypothetical protein
VDRRGLRADVPRELIERRGLPEHCRRERHLGQFAQLRGERDRVPRGEAEFGERKVVLDERRVDAVPLVQPREHVPAHGEVELRD